MERLRPEIDRFPAAEAFRQYLYVTETDRRREELWRKLTSDNEWSSPLGQARPVLSKGDPSSIPWAIGYRMSQMAGWAGDMDELLGSQKLTKEQSARLRGDIAALCYALSEPDVNPRGSMTHLGNPNMPINRFCGLAWAAALIPDHPMAKTWLDTAAQYIRYKLAMNTAPGGTWGELLTYYAASAPHLMQTASVLARTGRLDESTAGWQRCQPGFRRICSRLPILALPRAFCPAGGMRASSKAFIFWWRLTPCASSTCLWRDPWRGPRRFPTGPALLCYRAQLDSGRFTGDPQGRR